MSSLTIDDVRARHPEPFRQASRRLQIQVGAVAACLAYGLFCAWLFDVSWQRLTAGLGRIGVVFGQMLVWKDFWSWDFEGIFLGLGQSLAMAFLGTIMASLVALPLAFLAARTVVRPALPRHVIRRLFDMLRGIDQLIWALVFVRALGLGPLSGLLAIFTSDIGTLGKLYSEALENVDRKQVEGVRATGASRMQVYRFGFLPQIFPVFLSQTLYYIESNTRSATVLGVVGAGGIGLQLSERMKVQYWDQAAFIMLLILLTVSLVDQASALIRRRFIGGPSR
ncbi:phosphonate ABC transporter, permease protein PhnE [Geminicoccus roseus]|uniref:phosphonate ABC transporter, permease protein PhnE n=1 Tax=Geminicoccus roseus TaxID=404900 RepID=UPI0004157AE1|nr:phosphonate ABC transporter, permease protein PhnE [Geminicoccus roseus]